MNKRGMFDKLLARLEEDFTVDFRRDMAALGAGPEEVERMLDEVMEEPPRSEWYINVERELYEFIKLQGQRLRHMLSQPISGRAEPFTDMQLHALIQENQRQERNARQYIH